ncbi:MAG: imelysin family protein [Polyangiaceae bacterium]
MDAQPALMSERMQRRNFGRACASALLAGSLPLACQRAPQRGEVLAALVREVVVDETRACLHESQRLRAACATLSQHCTQAGLESARSALGAALGAWKRVGCFKSGPLVETNALLRATYFPARPALIEELLLQHGELDATRVDALGVDSKGLFALEYLLFPFGNEGPRTLDHFDKEPRRRQLSVLLADTVARGVEAAATQLGDGALLAEQFARGGQQSLSRLVNQLVMTIETLAGNRLDSGAHAVSKSAARGKRRRRLGERAVVALGAGGAGWSRALVSRRGERRAGRPGARHRACHRPAAACVAARISSQLGTASRSARDGSALATKRAGQSARQREGARTLPEGRRRQRARRDDDFSIERRRLTSGGHLSDGAPPPDLRDMRNERDVQRAQLAQYGEVAD